MATGVYIAVNRKESPMIPSFCAPLWYAKGAIHLVGTGDGGDDRLVNFGFPSTILQISQTDACRPDSEDLSHFQCRRSICRYVSPSEVNHNNKTLPQLQKASMPTKSLPVA